ncbi:MAG: histidinol dehydrogenase, partial [Proteobacteria bacterium]|nr:histidinol dehydrogenase [Pseudomonadota bacterium]
MKRIAWSALDEAGRAEALARPPQIRDAELSGAVASILAEVRRSGDAALRECAARFDHAMLDAIAVSEAEMTAAEASVDPVLGEAIREAAARIEVFHRACMSAPVSLDTAPGVRVERLPRPIGRAGLYIPAGSAPLPSTVLMLAIPARLAGCADVVLCSPPRRDG